MCRLLGVVTRAPMRLADSLTDLTESFTGLSREHRDGWGVAAWRADGELAVAKEVLPAHASEAFPRTLAESVTDAALLHIRMASPGLPTEARNTHPFSAGTIAFAHNGYFTPVDAVDELIDPELLAGAHGDTDSERYFLRVLARLRTEDPVDALARAAAEIRERARFASLNCLLLTERALYAYADENPESEVSRRRGPDFFRLRYQARADRVVVASSGIGPQPADDGWSVLPYRQVLEVRRGDLRISTHLVQPQVPEALAGA
ncbi:putative glutamine amidotransferase [Kitasatospora sp. GAS204A]|uniref:class II glutamine amidotransferase n=1 Tax=unclassified Kitasatospora TaxID=2633591 RepID=UPI00247559F8|nr:class II glutamine amidotransferase [Kitasatospora sp. GAS204B]MDH6118471.1 putative glutamine amidotransferase [Kitasatospora sp. GAS204B]